MEEGHEIPVVQMPGGSGAPRALVFTAAAVSLTPAKAKRARYVYNLRQNYDRLKESLQAVEHFAVICELSQERISEIRQAKDNALEELSTRFGEKLKEYDRRIGEGA